MESSSSSTIYNFLNIGVTADEFAKRSLVALIVAGLLAFGADSLVKSIWNKGHPGSREGFRATVLFGATHNMALSARAYLALTLLEMVLQNIPKLADLRLFASVTEGQDRMDFSAAAPIVAGYLWLGTSMCTIKKVLLLQSTGKQLGRVALFDYLLDFIIMVVTLLNILDLLEVDLSTGMQSILSMGGVGALVFSLATKNLAEGMVGSFALNAWDAFDVGDKVLLGDGTEGIVKEVGLIDTHLQHYDHTITRIPNGQLTTSRLTNLSRVKKSRCMQNIRFKYGDLEKLPAVLEEIKKEIQVRCPKIITDGSGAFIATLEKYEADHISGLIICDFTIPPRTADFLNNRQEFVLAIAAAMKTHDVQFAIPTIEYCGRPNTSDVTSDQ